MSKPKVGTAAWDYSVEKRLNTLEHVLGGLLDALDQGPLSDEQRQYILRPLRESLGK